MMVEGSAFTRNDVFQMAIRVAFVSAVTYFSIKWLVNQIDPTSKSRKKAEERAREQLRKYVLIAGNLSCKMFKILRPFYFIKRPCSAWLFHKILL